MELRITFFWDMMVISSWNFEAAFQDEATKLLLNVRLINQLPTDAAIYGRGTEF
jgi:hypothetical protein